MEFSAEPVEFKSLMVKRMLLNPQTTNTVWGNEVSRGNLAGVDDTASAHSGGFALSW